MTTDETVLNFVRQLTHAVDDPARLALADWFKAHPEYDNLVPVKWPIPKGFTRPYSKWFHNNVLPRHFGEVLETAPPQGHKWDLDWVIVLLHNKLNYWIDYGGYITKIAGQRAIVGESEKGERAALETAALIHEWTGTPVSSHARPFQGRSGVD